MMIGTKEVSRNPRLAAFSIPSGRVDPRSIPANWTSGRRTVEGNKAVGGVANSAHLSGDAADFTPKPGQTMAQLEAMLRKQFPDAQQILNEGDHVHVVRRGWNVPYFGKRGTTGLKRA